MRTTTVASIGLIASFACSGSESGSGGAAGGSGMNGSYSAVNGDPTRMAFKSGGVVEMDGASGTYTLEGEKLLVTLGSLTHTFIKDGNCIQDQNDVFGKLCIGGKAGEAGNLSTRDVPPMPTGIWIATNSDGEFRLEFKSASTLTLTVTEPGGQPASKQGSFRVEGDVVSVTLDLGEPMVLKYVNRGYESTSFGLPMRFVKQ